MFPSAIWEPASTPATGIGGKTRQRKRLRKLVLTTAITALPTLVVLGVLVAINNISMQTAALAAVFVTAALAVLLWWRNADFDLVQTYIERLNANEGPKAPPDVSNQQAVEMAEAVAALHQDLARNAEQTAAAAAARETALESLPDPVILIDENRNITFANQVAGSTFGGALAGKNLAAALRDPEVLDAADAVLSGRENSLLIDITVPGAVVQDFRIHLLALPAIASDGTVAVVLVRDMGAETRAERMRADFVANVSHELRTPLSALLGFVETLQGPAKDDAEARSRFLVFMNEQATRMARLIDDLLSLSRIELEEHRQPGDMVDLAALLAEVATLVDRKAKRRRVAIDNRVTAGTPTVTGDRDQLIQVFENLVSNAVKYGAADSVVTVSVVGPDDPHGRPGQLGIAVKDRGEGIPREHLPRLTERFYRVDSARSRELGGTGLGLAIVKHIVNRHRGQLAIDSIAGEGSVFTVFLPLPVAATEK